MPREKVNLLNKMQNTSPSLKHTHMNQCICGNKGEENGSKLENEDKLVMFYQK